MVYSKEVVDNDWSSRSSNFEHFGNVGAKMVKFPLDILLSYPI